MILNILFESVSPTAALALTSPGVQPEYTGFEPANASEMVDLFTGDFKYNIPLMDVDGYPLNLVYHAGQGMESEASWVGLGWSLNPGVLNRTVRGLPDDFNGDQTTTITKMKPTLTMGIGTQKAWWVGCNMGRFINGGAQYGVESGNATTYNNYTGYGRVKDHDQHLSLSIGMGRLSINQTSGVGNSVSSQDGATRRSNYSNGGQMAIRMGPGFSISHSQGEGTSINTRSGIVEKTKSNGISVNSNALGISAGIGVGSSGTIPSGPVNYYPRAQYNTTGGGWGKSNKYGFWAKLSPGIAGVSLGALFNFSIYGGILWGKKGFYNSSKIREDQRTLNAFGYMYLEGAGKYSLMDFNRFHDGPVFEETPVGSMASATYDMFFASAQGMGSSFRPFRSNIGVFHDPETTSENYNSFQGNEIGGPLILHEQNTKSTSITTGRNGKWSTSMEGPGILAFNTTRDNVVVNNIIMQTMAPHAFVEKTYFKAFGELTQRDEDYETSVKNDELVSPALVGNDAFSPITAFGRKGRDKRSQYIECLTGSQARDYGFEKTFSTYTKNTFSLNTSSHMMNGASSHTRTSNSHISEVSLTNTSGDRYIYGIPSYNLSKKSVVFNASARTESSSATYTISNEGALQSHEFPQTSYSDTPLGVSNAYQVVQYSNADLNSNKRGIDNLYQEDKVPAYANSYLLTNILSSDYVDITGNGPTYDDFGNFTKFNYSKENNYQWREPVCFNPSDVGALAGTATATTGAHANLDPGLICDKLDDKASYEYGSRETYYMHSIETKNYVAVFRTSGRYDAVGVTDEKGLVASNPETLKLDAIDLYSKSELMRNGGHTSNSTPLKTVHFVYNYSLCPGTFNSIFSGTINAGRGKLTLEKVYFTYGKSQKSGLSPYEFEYADNDHNAGTYMETNFGYNPRSVDRWGTYMPNNGNATGNPSVTSLNNVEFPYTNQDKTSADAYSAAWNLTQIVTPSGAKITITYEADDYGYVQNEQAGQMLGIVGCFAGTPTVNASVSPSSTLTSNIKEADHLIVDLSRLNIGIPVTASASANAIAQNLLFKPDKKLYFKCFVKLAGPENGDGLPQEPSFEYIPGYATVMQVGLFDHTQSGNTYASASITGTSSVNCYKYAFIKLKKEIAFNSQLVNPITIAAWDFMRNYVPRIAYPGSQPANMGDPANTEEQQSASIDAGMAVAIMDSSNAFTGQPNKRFFDRNFCSSMILGKSMVRAFVPYKRKLGGGHRVKQITTNDNWAPMTTGINSSGFSEHSTDYTQSFEYTTEEDGEKISSGVAFYEPLIGGDEISLRQPLNFTIKKQYGPNDNFFRDTPLNEMFYPSAQVGYSKVTVKNLPDQGSTSCSQGRMEYDFYTAKDFPIQDFTGNLTQLPDEHIPTIDNFLLVDRARKVLSTSQGSLLKFNDMHGKLKSVSAFGPNDENEAVSKVEYYYKCTDGKNGSKNLVTKASCIDEHNVITLNKTIARDIDVTVDTRENMETTDTQGRTFLVEDGLQVFLTPVLPFFMVSPDIPYVHGDKFNSGLEFGIRAATMTKIVQEYGIVDRVLVRDDKSVSTTENLLWDSNTGNVVLTKTSNNFEGTAGSAVYNFNYPAYWGYREMSSEYKRDGISLYCPYLDTSPARAVWDASTGVLTATAVNSNPVILELGDEVAVYKANDNTRIGDRFWVVKDPHSTYPANYVLVDREGKVLSHSTPSYSAALNTYSNTNYKITVVKPFNFNQLDASMGFVSSLINPMSMLTPTIGEIAFTSTTPIVNAGAQEYSFPSGVYMNTGTLIANGQVESSVPPNVTATINPIVSGFYGAFKPTKTYQFQTLRNYSSTPNNKTDGTYNTYTPFWTYNLTPSLSIWDNSCRTYTSVEAPANWRLLNYNVHYSPYGELLQSKDALELSSAQRFGYNHTLPVISAKNALVQQVGFDSFEEYAQIYSSLSSIQTNSVYNSNIYNNDYLGFYPQSTLSNTPGTTPQITTSEAHTGRFSLKLSSTSSVSLNYPVGFSNTVREITYTILEEDSPYKLCKGTIHRVLDCSSLQFNEGGTYIISMWVKGASTPTLDYSNLVSLVINQTCVNGSGPHTTPSTLTPVKTGIVNGWQKLDYQFVVAPVTCTPSIASASVGIKISATGGAFYLDDFRIQPFNSTMVCKVYDPYSLRLCAELNDRNYATILEYDNEGALVRKKKETEKALYTVSEIRSGQNKR